MLTVKLRSARPSVAEAAAELGLREEELDPEFGVVGVDPEAGLYAVSVDDEAAERAAERPGVGGPYSDPPIEPYGPRGV